MAERESTIELIWGHPILDEGFTAIPNVILHKAGKLGITDREFHFIAQLASFKFSTDSEIRPSYRTLAERMGRNARNLRKIANSLEEKGFLIRKFRRTENGNYETTIFDLTPLIEKLFPEGKGGTDEIISTPPDEIAMGGTDENVTRIKQKKNKTNNEEERRKLSPEVFIKLKEKGLSNPQITLINLNRPNLTMVDIKETWNWITKEKRFKNKEATFYTALIENWTKPAKHK